MKRTPTVFKLTYRKMDCEYEYVNVLSVRL